MFENIVTSIGRFSYKNRKIIVSIALVLFVLVLIIQSFVKIEYSYAEESLVTDVFPQDDTLVIVYDNFDEDRIQTIIDHLSKDEHVTSINAYANTLGMPMSPKDLSSMMGIDEVFVNTLFYIHEYGMSTTGMTLADFVGFISSDSFLNNKLFSEMIDENSKSQIEQLGTLVSALASEEKYTAQEISDMLEIDHQLVQSIFYIAQLRNMNAGNIPGTLLGTLAGVLGMNPTDIERVFNIKPVQELLFSEFVDIIGEMTSFAQGIINSEQLAQLSMLQDMSTMVKENTTLYPEDIQNLFSVAAGNEMFNEENLTLLYIMSRSNTMDMSGKTVPLYEFFTFLSEKIMTNEAFSSFFDESVAAQFEDAKIMMEEGKAQLIGTEHSRMVITLDYVPESLEMNDFYVSLTSVLDRTLIKDYQLVGNSAMSYEVSQTFATENLIISIVTAIAIFIVVWTSFKNFKVSLLLICVIECAVFAMMSVMTIMGEPMFFIALILVQCILMGTMIDYAILFTTYYFEVRKEYTLDKALPEVMRRSTYAILTSSLILILVTLICGVFMQGTVAAILKTLGIGSLCATLLILFVLPSLLVIFDKHIVNQDEVKEAEEN